MHNWEIGFFRVGSDGLREIGVRAPNVDTAIDAARTRLYGQPITIVYVMREDIKGDELGNMMLDAG